MAEFQKVATITDVPAGTGKVVEVGGKAIALFNCEGRIFAIDNTCRHRGGPLGDGSLSGTTVTCPWHGWEYEVTTGVCALDPGTKVDTFDVKVEGHEILVRV